MFLYFFFFFQAEDGIRDKLVTGVQTCALPISVEGTFRAHQVPLPNVKENPEHLRLLEAWMTSYGAQELFDDDGRLMSALAALAPKGERRLGANPHANGGRLLADPHPPDFPAHPYTGAPP